MQTTATTIPVQVASVRRVRDNAIAIMPLMASEGRVVTTPSAVELVGDPENNDNYLYVVLLMRKMEGTKNHNFNERAELTLRS